MSPYGHRYPRILFYAVLAISINIIKISQASMVVDDSSIDFNQYEGLMPLDRMKNVASIFISRSSISLANINNQHSFPNIKTIQIIKSYIEDVPEDIVLIFPNLNLLILDSVKFDYLNLNEFNPYPLKLTGLSLSHMNLGNLNGRPFHMFKKLKYLGLDFDGLTSLPDNVFEGLDELDFVTITGNYLSTINKEVLLPLSQKLQILDLSNNQIEHFGPENIPYLPELGILRLHSNPLNHVDIEEVKKNAPKLSRFSFGDYYV